MNPTPEYQIYKPLQRVLKQYPNFARLYSYDQPLEVRTSGFEALNPKKGTQRPKHEIQQFVSQLDSLRRSKTQITDIVLSNKFDMFATFTFNGDEKNRKKYGYAVTNRQNPDECKNKMSAWLKRQRERRGRFSYLIVPEYHKDGKSLHFHALMHGYNGKITERKHEKTGHILKHKGKPIYTINSYKLGHSDLKKINQTDEDLQKVASYIKKYITKDMPQFANRKRYWCSQDLIRPTKTHNPDIDPFTMETFQNPYRLKNLTITTAPGNIPLLNDNEEFTTWDQAK